MLYISEPCQRDYDDTSRGQVNQNGVRQKEGQVGSEGNNQVSESIGNSHGKREELGRQEQDNLLGRSVLG